MAEQFHSLMLSKIVEEKTIRWIEHLEKSEMLTEKLFGFRKVKSCVRNL